jgi:cbb3-type cytochrome oxidase maturation protein
MTGLQIYILVVPVFLAGVGWAAYWWVVRYDRKHHHAD